MYGSYCVAQCCATLILGRSGAHQWIRATVLRSVVQRCATLLTRMQQHIVDHSYGVAQCCATLLTRVQQHIVDHSYGVAQCCATLLRRVKQHTSGSELRRCATLRNVAQRC
jgi:hypothetical protein